MKVPKGWKLVPVKLTAAMLAASKRAMKDYIERFPATERSRKARAIPVDLKHEMRFAAVIAAAPPPASPPQDTQ